MSREDINQFYELLKGVKNNAEKINNELLKLEISALGITTKLLMTEAKKPEAEPPKKCYKVYYYPEICPRCNEIEQAIAIYIKEENAKKRVEELKAEWPNAGYLQVLFDDFFDEVGRA